MEGSVRAFEIIPSVFRINDRILCVIDGFCVRRCGGHRQYHIPQLASLSGLCYDQATFIFPLTTRKVSGTAKVRLLYAITASVCFVHAPSRELSSRHELLRKFRDIQFRDK